MAHARPEVRDADVGLLRPAQVRLRDEHVAHRQHAEPAQLLRRVEDDRREAGRHLRVEADLDARLDLVLALDEQVEQLLRVDDRLAEVRHQADQRRVPLVDDLRARGVGGDEVTSSERRRTAHSVASASRAERHTGTVTRCVILHVTHHIKHHVMSHSTSRHITSYIVSTLKISKCL